MFWTTGRASLRSQENQCGCAALISAVMYPPVCPVAATFGSSKYMMDQGIRIAHGIESLSLLERFLCLSFVHQRVHAQAPGQQMRHRVVRQRLDERHLPLYHVNYLSFPTHTTPSPSLSITRLPTNYGALYRRRQTRQNHSPFHHNQFPINPTLPPTSNQLMMVILLMTIMMMRMMMIKPRPGEFGVFHYRG